MRPLTTAVVALVALTGIGTTTTAVGDTQPQNTPIPKRCTFQAFKPFSEHVWALKHWNRGKPRAKALNALQRRLSCAERGKGAMKHRWAADRLRYGRYRILRHVAPYPGGGTWWAIPYPVVYCESGTSGLWYAQNPSGASGPYQLMPEWGAPFPADTWHEKIETHRIAGELWAGGAGAGNWVCA